MLNGNQNRTRWGCRVGGATVSSVQSGVTAALFALATVVVLSVTAAPAAAQPRTSASFGAMTVTVVGGNSQDVSRWGDGARILLDGHEILAEPDRITVDGVEYPVEAFGEIVANADGYGLSITVDDRPVMQISQLDGLRAAAERGDAGAQNDLGVRYALGDGVDQDDVRAAQLYLAAAEQGHILAEANYAWRLWRGFGVEQDRETAVTWARRAAERDNAGAQYLLGLAYQDGDGVDAADPVTARTWFERAAENGHAVSMNQVGVIYARGDGVAVDIAEAMRWYDRAREAGSAVAAANLAHHYWRGNGVEQDLERAEALFAEAVAGGNDRAAEWLASVREELSGPIPEAPPGPRYHFAENGAPTGPMTLDELAQAIADARLDETTLVWREGMADWAPARSLEEVAPLLDR